MEEFEFVVSEQGPALWEEGEEDVWNNGKATVIATEKGERPSPILVEKGRALIPIRVGYHVVKVEHRNRKEFKAKVFRIVEIGERTAKAELIGDFDNGEWHIQPPAFLQNAIIAAEMRSMCFKCRRLYYVREERVERADREMATSLGISVEEAREMLYGSDPEEAVNKLVIDYLKAMARWMPKYAF